VDKVILTEEERFGETLDTGLKLLSDAMAETKAKGDKILSGEVAFKLYDTFRLPPGPDPNHLRGRGPGRG
jgi:alanyl-tRNA synthetase